VVKREGKGEGEGVCRPATEGTQRSSVVTNASKDSASHYPFIMLRAPQDSILDGIALIRNCATIQRWTILN